MDAETILIFLIWRDLPVHKRVIALAHLACLEASLEEPAHVLSKRHLSKRQSAITLSRLD